MKVTELISELKNMPGNLEVHVSAHDNYEWESAGWVCGATHFIKEDFIDSVVASCDADSKRIFKDMPEECVILNC